jgi:hypothetical protein
MRSDSNITALDAGDAVFHQAYRATRDDAQHEVPILVVLPTELALHQGGNRHRVGYCRPAFGRAKSAAHVAVALFTLACCDANAERRAAGLSGLLAHLAAALAEEQDAAPAPVDEEIRALLQCCLSFARAACEGSPCERRVADFANAAGPSVLRITELATCEQVAGLHEAVEALSSRLSPAEQAELQVVVVGDHQARTRSLGMQYFKRRFGEKAETDERVTYGENISDEQEAISLVATRRLDQRIARAFFGDEARLQRDVLGDAAKRCIEQMWPRQEAK